MTTAEIVDPGDTRFGEAPDVVRVMGVSKRFVVRRDNSLKERLVTLGRAGKRHREDFWALKDVSMTIKAGTTVGLIGHNGSGKSTLLKVIGGIIDPTKGDVLSRGRIAALLELGAGFHPDLTGRENVYLNASILGLSRIETDASLDDILAFAGIGDFIDTQVKFYSSGMYVRLAFAVAVHTDPDLLLVDEVLAVGDEAFQRKCLDKIRSFQQEGRTIILVTHSLGLVQELCDRAILLNQGKVVIDGDPREAVGQFRDILEDRRIAGLRPGEEVKRTSRIRSVTASGFEDEQRKPEVSPGDDLIIDVGVRSEGGLDDWMVGVQIDNALGQIVYGTTTRRMGISLDHLKGDQLMQFRLRDTHFGPGKYFVNISLIDRAGVHVHDWPQAATFDAAEYDLAVGMVYAVPEFTLGE
jgi:ABC-2 type transport system ATP-binding protein